MQEQDASEFMNSAELPRAERPAREPNLRRAAFCVALGAGLVYYFSNPAPSSYFDYTFRTAVAMLHGHLGLSEQPPSWLNEVVPIDGSYYSVFPLGAVLSMMPAAVLKVVGLIENFPAALIVSLIAAATALCLFLLAASYDLSTPKCVLLTLFPLFGSWMLTNLAFGSAWQIALGFAVAGEAGALYFLLARPNPWLAGACFALAFGNRTEVIVVAPLLLYLLLRGRAQQGIRAEWPRVARFCAVPFLLGVATLAYNYARFHSPLDFGYARIPVIQNEDWFKHGLFTVYAIPVNAQRMLLESWRHVPHYPYLMPNAFGGSILLSSPFLFLALRPRARDKALKLTAWAAVAILTLTLWLHSNTGGWQFSYRYAMILLPWLFLIILEGSPTRVRPVEIILLAVSILINAWATYLFLWTSYITP